MQNAWNKDSEENFEFTILEECEPELLDDLEIYYIKKYDTFNNREKGYNLLSGGGHANHSLESRAKIGEANSGENNPMYGKTGDKNPRSKYTIWNNEKCHYDHSQMFREKRDGSEPARCFKTKYKSKDVPIGMNFDYLSCELIHDLINEYTME